jgi:hypothetical protein
MRVAVKSSQWVTSLGEWSARQPFLHQADGVRQLRDQVVLRNRQPGRPRRHESGSSTPEFAGRTVSAGQDALASVRPPHERGSDLPLGRLSFELQPCSGGPVHGVHQLLCVDLRHWGRQVVGSHTFERTGETVVRPSEFQRGLAAAG